MGCCEATCRCAKKTAPMQGPMRPRRFCGALPSPLPTASPMCMIFRTVVDLNTRRVASTPAFVASAPQRVTLKGRNKGLDSRFPIVVYMRK